VIVAEIKSAIELAMERTKDLVMGEDEKKELVRKDLEDRLKALMRRFLEGMTDRERFFSDYEVIKANRREKRLLLADILIQGFEAFIENERFFELLELLGEDTGSDIGHAAKALEAGFKSELKAREMGIREEINARLREIGISGSAVEPNVVEWQEWKDAAWDIAASLKQHLVEWKDRVLAVPA
jgi:hypothetical protein